MVNKAKIGINMFFMILYLLVNNTVKLSIQRSGDNKRNTMTAGTFYIDDSHGSGNVLCKVCFV